MVVLACILNLQLGETGVGRGHEGGDRGGHRVHEVYKYLQLVVDRCIGFGFCVCPLYSVFRVDFLADML